MAGGGSKKSGGGAKKPPSKVGAKKKSAKVAPGTSLGQAMAKSPRSKPKKPTRSKLLNLGMGKKPKKGAHAPGSVRGASALAAVMSKSPRASLADYMGGQPPDALQRQKALINEVRAKLKSPRIKSPKTRERLRNILAGAERDLKDLRGERAHNWSSDRPSGPIPASSGSVLLGDWSYSGTSHEENRRFRNAEGFLGYLENRPGVVGVLSAEPSGGKGVASPRSQVPQEVAERIRNTECVLRSDTAKREEVAKALEQVWGWIDAVAAGEADGDCWVEFEVDGESTRDE